MGRLYVQDAFFSYTRILIISFIKRINRKGNTERKNRDKHAKAANILHSCLLSMFQCPSLRTWQLRNHKSDQLGRFRLKTFPTHQPWCRKMTIWTSAAASSGSESGALFSDLAKGDPSSALASEAHSSASVSVEDLCSDLGNVMTMWTRSTRCTPTLTSTMKMSSAQWSPFTGVARLKIRTRTPQHLLHAVTGGVWWTDEINSWLWSSFLFWVKNKDPVA